jgi:hypothetical protein
MRLLRLLYTVPLRFRSLFRRDQVERDLEDEFRDHLERRIDAGIAQGMTSEDARNAALRSVGGVEQRKEECRDMRHVTPIEHCIQDFRFAVRQLRRYRGFAWAAVAVLALGIAASVAIFGFVDAALIKPLPYREPSRLVTVFGARPDLAPSQTRGNVSYLDFLDWQERSTRAFRSLAAYDVRNGFTLITPEGAERVSGLRVSSGFFHTLGVSPLLGRDFGRDEQGPAAPPTVVLSYHRVRADAAPPPVDLEHALGAQRRRSRLCGTELAALRSTPRCGGTRGRSASTGKRRTAREEPLSAAPC